MIFATKEIEAAFWKCDASVISLAFAADAFCRWHFNTEFRVTSGLRRGDPGVHGKGRAVDGTSGAKWNDGDAQTLANWINTTFPYEGVAGKPFVSSKTGKPYLTALIETKGVNYGTRPATGNCIHLQTRP